MKKLYNISQLNLDLIEISGNKRRWITREPLKEKQICELCSEEIDDTGYYCLIEDKWFCIDCEKENSFNLNKHYNSLSKMNKGVHEHFLVSFKIKEEK